jgi:hypothetical protein
VENDENTTSNIAELDVEFLDLSPEEVLVIAYGALGKIRDNFELVEACIGRLRSDYKK